MWEPYLWGYHFTKRHTMKHTLIIGRDNGQKVSITASLTIGFGDNINWSIEVATCEKGKRTWISQPETINNWEIRRLPTIEQRVAYVKAEQLKFCTDQEIHRAKLELWKKLEPKL